MKVEYYEKCNETSDPYYFYLMFEDLLYEDEPSVEEEDIND